MKRESTIAMEHTVSELLVMFQLQGALDSAYVEDWATGTSVEELFDALQVLGDGEWLRPLYPDHGVNEAADAWLYAYMVGREVATPAEAAAASKKAEAAERRAAKKAAKAAAPLREYMDYVAPEARKGLLARIKKEKSFEPTADTHLENLSKLVAGMCVIPDPQFGELDLASAIVSGAADIDLAEMTRFYLNQAKDIHESIGDDALPWATTAKRIKAVEKALPKASA